jgi:hypothetical protein
MNLFRFGILLSALLVASATSAWAHATYTGYSGAPGLGTCAGACHGSSGGTIITSGFPLTYAPDSTYLITIRKLSGNSIRNFNASCRLGTGSQNAGVLAAGSGTSTYNTSGETNGVHLSSINQDSATFSWTAPASGSGSATLYVAGLQGGHSGLNTVIVATSDEAVLPPGVASNPFPAEGEQNVPATAVLTWTAGNGATSHDVYFGFTSPPLLVQNQAGASFDPPGDLLPDTVYYWRIDERNDAGVAEGVVWHFRTVAADAVSEFTMAVPGELTLGPVYPNPFNATLTISFALPQTQDVTLTLYNILGQPVAILARGSFAAGTHHLQWSSESVGTGIYFLRLQSGAQARTAKVAALK